MDKATQEDIDARKVRMRDSPYHNKEAQARLYRALGGYIKAASNPHKPDGGT